MGECDFTAMTDRSCCYLVPIIHRPRRSRGTAEPVAADPAFAGIRDLSLSFERPNLQYGMNEPGEMRMGDGGSWIAQAFKLFDVLINPRSSPQPDPPVATASADGLTSEAPADNTAASSFRVELASEADPLAPHDEPDVETSPAGRVASPPVQLDDESRRKLIRQLFNEYWNGIEDKPPTFAERLEIAERYINDQLASRDVGWRLDAITRKQLGLPSSRLVG
jgi:hypothetical protein